MRQNYLPSLCCPVLFSSHLSQFHLSLLPPKIFVHIQVFLLSRLKSNILLSHRFLHIHKKQMKKKEKEKSVSIWVLSLTLLSRLLFSVVFSVLLLITKTINLTTLLCFRFQSCHFSFPVSQSTSLPYFFLNFMELF